MPKTITNKTTRAERIRNVKAGLTKYFGSTALVLAGTSYLPAALQAFLQADVDANDASTQARANMHGTVMVAKTADSSTAPVLRAIEAQVRSMYGEAPNAATVLADFGYAPRKQATKTVAVKTAAVAQAKATRAARHTVGPKAKAKIKGTVVPATSAESPQAVSPTPAPTGSSNSTSTSSPSASPSGATTPSHQ